MQVPLTVAQSSPTSAQAVRVLPRNRFFRSNPDAIRPSASIYMRTAVGEDYFDGTSPLSRAQRHFAVARRAGVKYLRCAFSWDAIEPSPGHYNWRFWDELVRLAAQNKITLLPYVAYTPKWVARNVAEYWKQPPRGARLYGDFMYTIAKRYRGRIRSWEIWNEPDNKDYWTGTADEFASMVMLAARRIRQADPRVVLILGGMAYGPGPFFDRLMNHYHIDDYVDVIAVHAYPESWGEKRAETVFEREIPAMREMITRDGSGDPLWLNEMGYADYRFAPNRASTYGVSVFYNYEHTRAYQAAMLFKFETMALAEKIPLTDWHRIDDFRETDKRLGPDFVNDHLGLVDASGKPKPDLFALAFFNRLLGKPVEVMHAQLSAPSHSQSVVEMFESGPAVDSQSSIATLVIVGWLRSSQESEVAAKTGTVHDLRAETVSVRLPCAPAKLDGVYDVEGRRVASPARISGRTVSGIPLRGDDVLIAQLTCAARQ